MLYYSICFHVFQASVMQYSQQAIKISKKYKKIISFFLFGIVNAKEPSNQQGLKHRLIITRILKLETVKVQIFS